MAVLFYTAVTKVFRRINVTLVDLVYIYTFTFTFNENLFQLYCIGRSHKSYFHAHQPIANCTYFIMLKLVERIIAHKPFHFAAVIRQPKAVIDGVSEARLISSYGIMLSLTLASEQ